MRQKESKIRQNTIAGKVADYIEINPTVKNALQRGIVNYSALVREIQESLKLKDNFEAILIAVRRNAEKLMKKKKNIEEKAKKVLSKSNIEIKTKMAVIIVDNNSRALSMVRNILSSLGSDAGEIHVIQGSAAISIVLEQKLLKKFKKLGAEILRINKDQIEVIIKSPEDIEDVPGVVSLIVNSFSERGINMQETLSCYTDTILLFDKNDINEVVEIVNKLTK